MRARKLSRGSRCDCVETCVSQRAGVARFFSFVYTLPYLYVCVCDSVRACRGAYFEMFDILGGHFEVFDSQHHFPSLLLFFALCTGPGTHCHP